MALSVRIDPQAEASLDQQFLYILKDKIIPAYRLLDVFYDSLELIAGALGIEAPAKNRWPRLTHDRTYPIKGFPELWIIYEVDDLGIYVWDVWHSKRHPNKINKPE